MIDFNLYRESYPTMKYEEKVRWHSVAYAEYPEQMHFNNNALRRLLVSSNDVVEMGGWRGDAAARMLYGFHHIRSWRNYELCTEARENSNCNDIRYRALEPPTTFADADTFIASHVLEHLSEEEIVDTLERAKREVEWIYVDCPVDDDVEDSTSYHVVSNAWGIIAPIMSDWKLQGKGHSEHGVARWYSR